MLELTKGVALHAFETRGDRHRSAGRIGLLAAALCASAAPAWAATFYVRSSGNDAQNGRNPATAFASIRRAASQAGGGDTVVVGPGRYAEGNITPVGNGRPGEVMRFLADRVGSATGDPAGDVLLDASGFEFGFRISSRPWVIVNGFTVMNANEEGIAVKSGSDHSVVANCIVLSNHGRGVWMRDSPGVIVFNNLIYANGGTGIDFAGEGDGSSGGVAVGNTVYGNALDGIRVEGLVASRRVTVVQNVIAQNLGRGINVKELSVPGFVGQWNLNIDGYGSEANKAAFDFGGSPLLVDPTGPDQTLGGPGHGDDDFHLRQILAGQTEQSSAVDGSPFTARWFGLTRSSTETGGTPDSAQADLGFHYGNETDLVSPFKKAVGKKIAQLRGRALTCQKLGSRGASRCVNSLHRLRRLCGQLAEKLCG